MAATQKSTLKRVAEHAGVSIASASRVLNGLPASAGVTERVRRAAAELGYVPDATARSLKVGRTEQIALAVADVGDPVYAAMTHEVSRVVTHAGFRLVVSSTGSDHAAQAALLASLDQGFADGLILCAMHLSEDLVRLLPASRLPTVVIGTLPADVPIDTVQSDTAAGMHLALSHLATQGRRRIAFIDGPGDDAPGDSARLRGYRVAMAELGMPVLGGLSVNTDDVTFAAGLTAAEALLGQATPDAIVCANDLIAVAALKVLLRRGMRVPDDIALVGMDDTAVAELTTPSVTSVDLRSTARAHTAAELLLRRLKDPGGPVERVVVEPLLTVRESSVDPSFRSSRS